MRGVSLEYLFTMVEKLIANAYENGHHLDRLIDNVTNLCRLTDNEISRLKGQETLSQSKDYRTLVSMLPDRDKKVCTNVLAQAYTSIYHIAKRKDHEDVGLFGKIADYWIQHAEKLKKGVDPFAHESGDDLIAKFLNQLPEELYLEASTLIERTQCEASAFAIAYFGMELLDKNGESFLPNYFSKIREMEDHDIEKYYGTEEAVRLVSLMKTIVAEGNGVNMALLFNEFEKHHQKLKKEDEVEREKIKAQNTAFRNKLKAIDSAKIQT